MKAKDLSEPLAMFELKDLVQKKISQLSRSGHNYDAYYRLIDAINYSYAMGVRGDVVEFGTWTGRSSVVIAESFKSFDSMFKDHKFYEEKSLFFCDSFSGLPEIVEQADLESIHVQKGVWKKNSMSFFDPESFKSLISEVIEPNKFEIVVGFFSDTVSNTFKNRCISVVHCDVDLYSSTLDCLGPLFSMKCISPGCIILFDDWNNSYASPEHGQRKAFRELIERFSVSYSDEGSYSYHGRSFIIHSYQ
jgi:O-methyltransferase